MSGNRTSVIAVVLVLLTISASIVLVARTIEYQAIKTVNESNEKPVPICCKPLQTKSDTLTEPKTCVFKTLFEGQYDDTDFLMATPENAKKAIEKALEWIAKEQLPDGSYYGGFHATQNILKDPNAKGDPATTSIVAIAFLKSGSTPYSGKYSKELIRAHNFLLTTVENCPESDPNITRITGTQAQIKLGANIDVSLTTQFFTNILPEFANDTLMSSRIKKSLQKCVSKIQKNQNSNGSFTGAGWAGVLQSSISNNALESAQNAGIAVDSSVLEKSRNYQKNNYNASSAQVTATDGAGITLYAISSTSRASATEVYAAKKVLKKAKKEGKVKSEDINVKNLEDAGLSTNEAIKYTTAYKTNKVASDMAQRNDVMSGFGNNGGEEFYSYLQTGEGLYISRDKAWKQWYSNVIGRLLTIQTPEGNWQGHHCITSPVFCTATCILILSGGKA